MTRGYSSEEIMAMQRDAIRRVNEMRRISAEKLRQSGPVPPPVPAEPKAEPPQEMPKPPEPKPENIPSVTPPSGFGALLQTIGKDHETLLLLSLLFLLIREGADTALILALVYVLL